MKEDPKSTSHTAWRPDQSRCLSSTQNQPRGRRIAYPASSATAPGGHAAGPPPTRRAAGTAACRALRRRRGRPDCPVRRQSSFCRCRPKQRHTAGYQDTEITIHYPFHPQASQTAIVTNRRGRAGEAQVTIRQPDGTLMLLPEWMARPQAAAVEVREIPRLPLESLLSLRAVVDTALVSVREQVL